MSTTDREAIARIAFDESVKGLAIQDATLTSIRQSTTALGTLSGVIATFLGKEILARCAPSAAACYGFATSFAIGVAVSSALLAIIMVGEIFRPREGWVFHSSPSRILDKFSPDGREWKLYRAYAALARYNEANAEKNDANLELLFWRLRVLISTIPIQIGAWLFALTTE